jgi:glycosyltransferase involved in cell wall biosynthesis
LALKKRVLIIVENAPVPFDPRVWKEAVTLSQNGYGVTVLCPRAKGYERGNEVLDGVHIYRHPMPGEGDGVFRYLSEYACALFWQFTYSWWIYARRGFDIIQGCNPPDDIFLVALPFKLLGVKYIFDHHDANPELYMAKFAHKGALYRVLVGLEKLTYRFADVVICTNSSYKDLAVMRGGIDPENAFVVRNGPDLESFRAVPPNAAWKYGKDYLLGYVGNMGEQDGLDILVDVAVQVKRLGRQDIQFICVGGGQGLPDLRKLIRDKDVEDIFKFTGRLPDDELMEILSTADVCVNPDKPCEMNDISTMIKIMEYMALSKPIVQFESKEGRFSAGEASLYADARLGVSDFTAKILWLLDNPDERRRMGDFGRRRVEQELAWEYSVKNLLAAYEWASRRLT